MPAEVNQRRFPRTQRRDNAELDLGGSSIPVVIHSLSPEGGGFMLPAPLPPALAEGKRVTVRLVKQDLEIPASIAWSTRGNSEWAWGGLSFQLAMAPAAQRQRFATWVVGLLRRDLAL